MRAASSPTRRYTQYPRPGRNGYRGILIGVVNADAIRGRYVGHTGILPVGAESRQRLVLRGRNADWPMVSERLRPTRSHQMKGVADGRRARAAPALAREPGQGCVSETYTARRPRPVAPGCIRAVVKETRVRPRQGFLRAPFQPPPFAVYVRKPHAGSVHQPEHRPVDALLPIPGHPDAVAGRRRRFTTRCW